jgi:hypothetical protein
LFFLAKLFFTAMVAIAPSFQVSPSGCSPGGRIKFANCKRKRAGPSISRRLNSVRRKTNALMGAVGILTVKLAAGDTPVGRIPARCSECHPEYCYVGPYNFRSIKVLHEEVGFMRPEERDVPSHPRFSIFGASSS